MTGHQPSKPTAAGVSSASPAAKAKARTLYRSLPIVAAALGAKFGVEVIVSGNEMMTDGKRIWVPAFDPEDPDLCELAYGVIAHEAFVHVRRTDFSVYDEAASGPLPQGRTEGQRAIRSRLLNIFDDVSGEYQMFNEYPGTRKTINAVLTYLVHRGRLGAVQKDQHPAKILADYCLLRGRASVLDQRILSGFADESEAIVRELFPAGALVRLNALIAEAKFLETTRDCLNQADLILDMLEEEEERARQQPPQADQQGQANQDSDPQQGGSGSGSTDQAGDGSDDGGNTSGQSASSDPWSKTDDAGDGADGSDDGSEDATGGGDADADGENEEGRGAVASESGSDDRDDDGSSKDDDSNRAKDRSSNAASKDVGDDDGKGSNADAGAGANTEEGSDSSGGSDAGGAYDPDGADAIADALSASAQEVGSNDLFKQAGQELSSHAASAPVQCRTPAMAQACAVEGNSDIGQGIVSRVRSTSGRIRGQLQGLVQASQQEDEVTRRRGRAMNGRKLTRIMTGDSRIFIQRMDRVAPNAAIHILVDRSLSMDEVTNLAQIEAAKQAGTKVTVPPRNRLDVAIDSAVALTMALEAIPGVNPAITAFPASRRSSGFGGDPKRDTGVLPLLRHGQKVRQTVSNFAIAPAGGTPLAEAMWYAAAQLVNSTREERKLLLVITDGEPSNADHVIDMVKRCEASGVELIGIGIQIDRVRELFPTAVVIQDIFELRGALFEIARRALTAVAA